jgi:hypothetical protein
MRAREREEWIESTIDFTESSVIPMKAVEGVGIVDDRAVEDELGAIGKGGDGLRIRNIIVDE